MSKWGGDFADEFKTTFKPGFHIGGVAEMMLNERWSIQPELLLSYEGTSDESSEGISAIYIKAPILVSYNFYVGSGRLSPGVGIFCATGVAGKIDGGENTFEHIDRFDWGLEAKLSYELQNGVFIGAGFSQGFVDTHCMSLKASIGYKFPYSKWLHSTYYKTGVREENIYNE